jgi:hypothetical protein
VGTGAGVIEFAFVSGGRLHVSLGGAAPRPFDSTFADNVRDRSHQIHKRHAWKGEGSQGGFGALAWGRQPTGPPAVSSRVTGVTRGANGADIVYALEIDRLTAVCAADPRSGSERRLLHGSRTRIRDLCSRPGRDEIACAVVHDDGTAAVALMSADATDVREVTEGESLDLHPAWAADGTARIAYQSAGLGRDAAGRAAGFGRFEIQVLDLDGGSLDTVASDPGADLERPRLGADGSLFYLSRPRSAPVGSVWRMAKDLVLLPARLLYALFQYLNFFSARYTGKPLSTAGGPKGKPGDLRRMLEWANIVDAQASGAEDDPGGVPRSHRLVRSRNGAHETIASGVACFDLAPDGSIVYATGSAIFRVGADGRAARLCDAAAVDAVITL